MHYLVPDGQETGPLTGAIIGAAVDVHRALGQGMKISPPSVLSVGSVVVFLLLAD